MIFAIDDNPYFINTLISVFKKSGYDYKTFNHPGKMLEALANFDKNISMILLYQYKELLYIQKKQGKDWLFLKIIFKGDIFTALPNLFKEVFEEWS